jgi:hypothetical protein
MSESKESNMGPHEIATGRPIKGEPITGEEQLERWARGESVHRRFERIIVDKNDQEVDRHPADECTPDFSCCTPELLAPPDVRQAFVTASQGDQAKFLGSFLGAALALAASKEDRELPRIHIAGLGPTHEN